ncbi:MAG: aspartate/glutamate racemase family protein [Chloroflexi bacterium]|nr:aspartate/glutamate racemase family protein [Chloroflexota bacterium]
MKKPGQQVGGHAVGIVVLSLGYPLVPGNVANATTFPFPVRYSILRSENLKDRILGGDSSLVGETIAAARELVQDGCRAIVGACGYFANYQREVAAAIDVPVFMSSLCQVPMIARSLKPGQAVGIICAVKPSLRPETLRAVGVDDTTPVVIEGLEDEPEFASAVIGGRGDLDNDLVERDVVNAAARMVANHPEVGAILLECSDIPPYARAVQAATGLAVWDFNSMIHWIYEGVVKRRYEGFV